MLCRTGLGFWLHIGWFRYDEGLPTSARSLQIYSDVSITCDVAGMDVED